MIILISQFWLFKYIILKITYVLSLSHTYLAWWANGSNFYLVHLFLFSLQFMYFFIASRLINGAWSDTWIYFIRATVNQKQYQAQKIIKAEN